MNWMEILALRRHEEIMREVENDRLARLAGQRRRGNMRSLMLALLGDKLINWGHQLKKKHGALFDSRPLQPSKYGS